MKLPLNNTQIKAYQGLKINSLKSINITDSLAIEEALQIKINGKIFSITMRSPGHDEELVRGLLYSEDIYKEKTIEPVFTFENESTSGHTTTIDVHIDESLIGSRYLNSRTLLSVSACGICGKTELNNDYTCDNALQNSSVIDAASIPVLFKRMFTEQDTFKLTGGVHAVAAFTLTGEKLVVCEDIGRHNAVDKVIGHLLINKQLHEAQILLVSGRISYEIVYKAFIAGIPILAAVSAPTTLSVDLAKELGITLLAFCREEKFTIYSHPSRIKI